MSALNEEIHDLLRFAAERAILPRYRNLADGQLMHKAADDPVTIADHECEAFLTEALMRLAPGVPVVGEEAAHSDPAVLDRLSGACWIIDPLDGTHNFAHGHPPFGIIVALADGGETAAGWLYDPLSGRFCHAARGQGAFVNGERVSAITTATDPPVAAISLLFMEEARRESVKRHIAPHYRVVDIPRCAAEQYPRLALGENDLSIFERTLPWDHAAGILWLNEAGGRAARPDGSAYRVDDHARPGLIGAASPALWDELAARMELL
ncbi:MAG: inositol monophosphatase [Novosphingobium sp.]|nr:inositol monophosphatase [Novosphingobium sp.]MCP5389714.1 inositol monophosphatase [Novosphingobium sp.]